MVGFSFFAGHARNSSEGGMKMAEILIILAVLALLSIGRSKRHQISDIFDELPTPDEPK